MTARRMNSLWQQALEVWDGGSGDSRIADVNRMQDDCGVLRLVKITATDGSYLVAGEDDDDEGNVDGYTFTTYTSDDIPMNTDGDVNIARFTKDVLSFLD